LTLLLDHCGPIVRPVKDATLVLNVLASYKKLDTASNERARENCGLGPDDIRVGIRRRNGSA
jgi:Asp-tRNA(Asn)/Glu-tRNA(Gln) amidotransferase A subunit family amidase